MLLYREDLKSIEVLNKAKDILTEQPNAKQEIQWFIRSIKNCTTPDLYSNIPISKKELEKINLFITSKLNDVPFQYIVQSASFWGRDFFVNENVLIPRPETETIVVHLKKNIPSGRVLEIGTGSGCLSITLELELGIHNITATDVSQPALVVANKNQKKHGSSILFVHHDFLNEGFKNKFDLVVSNPPYISKNEMTNLGQHIIRYEPHQALTDGTDGLEFYRRFSKIGKNVLSKGGRMILEFGGFKQKDDVLSIFEDYLCSIINDQNNEPRLIEAIYE